jgi:hypothetical protein
MSQLTNTAFVMAIIMVMPETESGEDARRDYDQHGQDPRRERQDVDRRQHDCVGQGRLEGGGFWSARDRAPPVRLPTPPEPARKTDPSRAVFVRDPSDGCVGAHKARAK